jgi:hypothetical protein
MGRTQLVFFTGRRITGAGPSLYDGKERGMKRTALLAILFLCGRWAAWAQAGVSPTLTVTRVDHWVIQDNHPWDDGERCKTIMAFPGEKREGQGQLLQANIERDASRESLDLSRFHICSQEPCSIHLTTDQSTPFQLCLSRGFLWPGKYVGTLWLGTLQKPRSFEVTFYVRDRLLRFLGLLLIGAGVTGSWFVKAWLKPQLSRLQALAPAAHLHLEFARLGLRLDRLPEYRDSLEETRKAVRFYEYELSEDVLDDEGLLPPRPPAPVNAPQVDPLGKYKQLLADASTHLDVLVVVVAGVEGVRDLDTANPPIPPDSAVETALDEMEKIVVATPLPSRDSAQNRVTGALAALRAALSARSQALQKGALQAAAPAVAAPSYQSYDQILGKIHLLNSGYWWIWAVLTVLTGYAFLILKDPLFGSPFDLVTAFIWGFGIPTTLTTVSSVAAALGITSSPISASSLFSA